jgi:hypothetical protein
MSSMEELEALVKAAREDWRKCCEDMFLDIKETQLMYEEKLGDLSWDECKMALNEIIPELINKHLTKE